MRVSLELEVEPLRAVREGIVWWTLAQAAKVLRRNRDTVLEWARRGILRAAARTGSDARGSLLVGRCCVLARAEKHACVPCGRLDAATTAARIRRHHDALVAWEPRVVPVSIREAATMLDLSQTRVIHWIEAGSFASVGWAREHGRAEKVVLGRCCVEARAKGSHCGACLPPGLARELLPDAAAKRSP